MQFKKRDKLSQVLQQWASQRALQVTALEQLRRRISETLDTTQPDEELKGNAPISRDLSWRGTAWFALGAAASLLTMAGYFWLSHSTQPQIARPAGNPDPLPPSFAWLQKAQIDGKATLLFEMERVFAERIVWVAETDGQVKLGLTEAKQTSQPAQPLAVRIVVVRRQTGLANDSPVWAVDLVSRGEQVVRVAPDNADDARLLVWAYPLPDGLIAVDTTLELRDPVTMKASASRLHENAIPSRIHSVHVDDVEYDVYQTVAFLGEKVD
jgi:hypothetical protein